MPNLTKEELKEAHKEALKEWLNEKYSQVGKWTIRCIGVFFFYLAMKWALLHGFKIDNAFPYTRLK